MSGRWPVTSALSNYPMALDEAHHRLLIGCRRPARMLAIDTETGKQTASVEIVGDTEPGPDCLSPIGEACLSPSRTAASSARQCGSTR